jgi:steroid 5-alpha reductase family enzyme
VFVLLTRISGIPLLRGRARKRWGEDAGYLAYRARTATLFPRPPKAQP